MTIRKDTFRKKLRVQRAKGWFFLMLGVLAFPITGRGHESNDEVFLRDQRHAAVDGFVCKTFKQNCPTKIGQSPGHSGTIVLWQGGQEQKPSLEVPEESAEE